MLALYILLPLLSLAALALLLLLLVYRKTFFMSEAKKAAADPYRMPPGFGDPDPTMLRLIRELDGRPYEAVEITARDGTRLFARYHHGADGAPLEIQCHGYRGVAVRDFCGGNPIAASLGHNTLLIDERAAGRSGGNAITFGIRERFDILDWVAYARERFGDIPIFLVGVSMGGAAVLMASGEEELPRSVVGVIADCPYSSPRDIICSVIRMMHLRPALAYPLVTAAARLYGRFSLSECSASEAAARADVPILLLHGECDRLVPCEMSREIAAAAGNRATLLTFPGADHGQSCMSNPPRYERAIADFCAACLTKVPAEAVTP